MRGEVTECGPMRAHLVPGEDPLDHPGPAGEEGGVLAAGVHPGQVRVAQPLPRLLLAGEDLQEHGRVLADGSTVEDILKGVNKISQNTIVMLVSKTAKYR